MSSGLCVGDFEIVSARDKMILVNEVFPA